MLFKKPRIKAEPQQVGSFPSHDWSNANLYDDIIENRKADERFKIEQSIRDDAAQLRKKNEQSINDIGMYVLTAMLGVAIAILIATAAGIHPCHQ